MYSHSMVPDGSGAIRTLVVFVILLMGFAGFAVYTWSSSTWDNPQMQQVLADREKLANEQLAASIVYAEKVRQIDVERAMVDLEDHRLDLVRSREWFDDWNRFLQDLIATALFMVLALAVLRWGVRPLATDIARLSASRASPGAPAPLPSDWLGAGPVPFSEAPDAGTAPASIRPVDPSGRTSPPSTVPTYDRSAGGTGRAA